MSKFLRIPYGDYTIETRDGGVILLNTGNENGVVRVTGGVLCHLSYHPLPLPVPLPPLSNPPPLGGGGGWHPGALLGN